MQKNLARKRRAQRGRKKMRELGVTRLCVHRTPRHIYAQLIVPAPEGDKVLTTASTLDKEVNAAGGITSNIQSARVVGNIVAKRAAKLGIKQVAFDRSGYKYHGCVKAL